MISATGGLCLIRLGPLALSQPIEFQLHLFERVQGPDWQPFPSQHCLLHLVLMQVVSVHIPHAQGAAALQANDIERVVEAVRRL